MKQEQDFSLLDISALRNYLGAIDEFVHRARNRLDAMENMILDKMSEERELRNK